MTILPSIMKYHLFVNIKYYNTQAIHANNVLVSLHYLLYWQQVAYHFFYYQFTIVLFLIVSHSNLTCTFTSTQVNATDISVHCDTMSKKRSLNPLYSPILNKISRVDS